MIENKPLKKQIKIMIVNANIYKLPVLPKYFNPMGLFILPSCEKQPTDLVCLSEPFGLGVDASNSKLF